MNQTTLAILAGGQGKRMGQPKAELQIAGQPILEYLLAHFSWPGPTLLVTAPGREHPPGWQRFTREVLDPVPDQGPLRGILTALQHLQTSQLIVATVDMPGVGRTQLDWLEQQFDPNTNGLLLRRADDPNQIEPFPSIFRSTAIETISLQLQNESRSVKALAGFDGFRCASAPSSWDQSVWINLNRPEDLSKLNFEPQINTDEHR